MLIEALVLGFASLLIWKLFAPRSGGKNLPPGPIRLPIIGNLLQLAMNEKETPYEVLQDLSRTYGPIMYIQSGAHHQVVLEDYQDIKNVLTNELWVERYFTDWVARRSFGKNLGVILGHGPAWKEMRRFSTRTLRDFGFGKQKSMEETIHEELQELSNSLVKKLDSGDQIVSMSGFFSISVLNILWSMMAGFRFDQNNTKLHELLALIEEDAKQNALGNVNGALFLHATFPYLAPLFDKFLFKRDYLVRKEVTEKFRQYFTEILKERRALGDYKTEQRDYIDVFLREIDAHKNEPIQTNLYTDEQFVVTTMDLFLGGSDTTSKTLEFAILYMILHPEVQAKVQAEIDLVIGTSRLPSIKDKSSMPYTEATLLEVFRRGNVFPLIIRSPAEATKIKNYDIPKGTVGYINLYALHMNEKVWENPFQFEPNRFLDNQNNVINAEKILPFGIGRRVCIGEALGKTSLFMFFTTMLQRFSFEISPVHGSPTTKPDLAVTLSPKPFFTKVTERQLTIK